MSRQQDSATKWLVENQHLGVTLVRDYADIGSAFKGKARDFNHLPTVSITLALVRDSSATGLQLFENQVQYHPETSVRMEMERLEFVVKGSQEDGYRVSFEIANGYANAYCTCPAGANGTVCKHRLAIMDGEVSTLIGGNESDAIRLKGLLKGTALQAAYADLCVAEEERKAAENRCKLARKALATAMHSKPTSASPGRPRVSAPLKTTPKRTSIEDFNITFADRLIEGWVFGVPEAFRDKLDIHFALFVDREKTKRRRQRMPKNPDCPPPTEFRRAWVRSEPPMRGFDVGDIFYDPPEARNLDVWADSLRMLRRSVQVKEARPDETPGSGWVKVELCYWESGEITRTEKHNLSQGEFENLLRTGDLPAGHEDKQGQRDLFS